MSLLQRHTGHAPAPTPAYVMGMLRPGALPWAMSMGLPMSISPFVMPRRCQCTLGWHRDSSLDGAFEDGGDGGGEAAEAEPKGAQLHSLEKAQKRKRVSPYPMYQCRSALLKDFGTLLHNFVEAGNTQPSAQATFDFSGEYSVVAFDYDVVARQAAIALGVHDLKNAIAGAGGLEFGPTSWVSMLDKPGGVATRFACVHSVACRAWTKSMPGELEIVVLPDDSHKYFPGERTILRFRLVG
ncbi:hypothetical protein B0H13DRAFT_2398303 [Mycena leptocephala]|nr:hypothetical protein B0H13DRAFT_2398303 [Mycena leptocephala]